MNRIQNKKHSNDSSALINMLGQLVAINSIFPKEQALANYIEKYLHNLQFSVTRIQAEPGRYSLVATYKKSDNYLCFYGHMDTVPPDPAWKHNPFSVQIHDDVARGLGVADMKGGLAVILLSAEYARQHHKPLKLAFGVDEENISLGSYTLTKTDFFKNLTMLISAESGQITNNVQDFSVNYGRNGRFVIEATIFGISAHAARSDLATNAIIQTSQFLASLHQIRLPEHVRLGSTEIIPFLMESHTDSFSIPNRSMVRLNILTVPGVTSSVVISQLKQLCRKLKIRSHFSVMKRLTPYMEAYEIDRNNEHIQQLENLVFSNFTVLPDYARSVADENRFAHSLNIPVISIGPIGGNDHTANEWVSLNSMQKTLEGYKQIIDVFS